MDLQAEERQELVGGWYETDKKKAKALPSKTLAKHFCQIKYAQLDSDVAIGVVNFDWQQMVEEYRKAANNRGKLGPYVGWRECHPYVMSM